jgi:hypothetical protein
MELGRACLAGTSAGGPPNNTQNAETGRSFFHEKKLGSGALAVGQFYSLN